jgi:hypothetical protein
MPRFALLIHDSPRGLHYDFFLEKGDALKTWALSRLPESGPEMPCEALADHRLIYLEFAGPISGGRGTVTRWDQGTYSAEVWTDETIIVELSGEKLTGRIAMQSRAGRWHVEWRPESPKTGN